MQNLEHDWAHWLSKMDWQGSLAISAHFDDSFILDGKALNLEKLKEARRITRHFFYDLDRQVYGNAVRRTRGNKHLKRFVVFETGGNRLHMHAVLQAGRDMRDDFGILRLKTRWQKYAGADANINIIEHYERDCGRDFTNYLLKECNRTNGNCIDLDNCYW